MRASKKLSQKKINKSNSELVWEYFCRSSNYLLINEDQVPLPGRTWSTVDCVKKTPIKSLTLRKHNFIDYNNDYEDNPYVVLLLHFTCVILEFET
jgi:hypothetical protein